MYSQREKYHACSRYCPRRPMPIFNGLMKCAGMKSGITESKEDFKLQLNTYIKCSHPFLTHPYTELIQLTFKRPMYDH